MLFCTQNTPLAPTITSFGVNPLTGNYIDVEQGIELKGPLPVRLMHRLGKKEEAIAFGGWHWEPVLLDAKDPREEIVGLQLKTDLYSAAPSIKIVGAASHQHYGSVTFRSSPSGDHWSATTHDGRRYVYALNQGLIASVKTPDGHQIEYEYVFHPINGFPLIAKKSNQLGTYIQNTYYQQGDNQIGDQRISIASSQDPRIGKIAFQQSPAGTNGSPVIVSQFYYGENWTLLIDGNEIPTLYEYDLATLNIQSITYGEAGMWHFTDSKPILDTILKKEHFAWKDKLLVQYAIEDTLGHVLLTQIYRYDNQNHLIQETFSGNLSGKGVIENYSKFYSYCQNKHHLLQAYEDNGNATHYQYNTMGQLVLKKTVDFTGSCRREGFFYDADGILIETILDDGTSEHIDDLTHVSERHLTRMTLTHEGHLHGLPRIIEEFHLEMETGQMIPGKTIIHTYSPQGLLIQTDHCDHFGVCRRVSESKYDAKGQLLYMKGEENKEILFNYGNGTKNAIDLHTGIEIVTVFDYMGRPFQRIHHDATGQVLFTSEKYDAMGRKIESIDEMGNSTFYTFDGLNHIASIKQPSIAGLEGEKIDPIYLRRYNALGQLVLSIDGNGNKTEIDYNSRGKPISVRHPDGTEQRFVYHMDGTLEIEKTRQGVIKHYQRDGFGRVLQIHCYDQDGHLLSSELSSYQAFRELVKVDPVGQVHLFKYDPTGRVSELVREYDAVSSVQNFHYDALGEIQETIEWLDAGKEKFKKIRYERDDQKKVTKAFVSGHEGESHELLNDEQSVGVPFVSHMETHVKNALNQNVRQVVFADQEGNLMIQTYNALGSLAQIEKRSAFGHLFFKQENLFDASGNKLEERLETPYRISKTRWEYNSNGSIEKLTEFADHPWERVTLYLYNSLGLLATIIKPDGIELHHEYDGKGRLEKLIASDHTFAYTYLYDANDRIISVKDELTQQLTSRAYTLFDQIALETLANGLTVEYKYDLQGRRIETILPDSSAIRYAYDSSFLRRIERIDIYGKTLYQHTYDAYDANGLILEETLPGDLGKVHYGYDAMKRMIEMTSLFWSEIIPENAYNAKGNIDFLYVEKLGKKEKKQFKYDGLDQIVSEEGQTKIQYAYDTFGNRMRKEQSSYRLNEKHQLIHAHNKTYGYDINGNLIFQEQEHTRINYYYDALSRLIRVEKPEESIVYEHDAFNRRVSKTITKWQNNHSVLNQRIRYVYDGDKEIGSMNASGQWIELRILGQGLGADIGSAISIETKGDIYIPLHDHQGSVVALVNLNNKKSIEYYEYTVYGEEVFYNLAGQKIEEAISPWRFSSKRYDPETGWIHFGKRQYIPAEGRWATPDLMGSFDSFNRYCFLKNNPLVHKDLYGLFSISSVFRSVLQFFKSAKERISNFQDSFLSPWMSGLDVEIKQLIQSVYGEAIYVISGFEEHPPTIGVCGNGEMSEKLRISFICGMLNTQASFDYSVQLISSTHQDNNVHFVYRGSSGFGDDLLNCVFLKMGYISHEATALSVIWKNLIEEMGGTQGGGLIIHYAHSIGGAETWAAGNLLTAEEKKMIRVITMGSPVIINDDGFHSVVNYVAVRDFVPLLDPIRYILSMVYEEYHVTFVGHWAGVPEHLLGDYWYYMGEQMKTELDQMYFDLSSI